VASIYAEDVAGKHARPKETAARLDRVLDYFGDKTLSYLNQQTCDDYVKARGHVAAARRELEDLRAAIRHHWEAGLCTGITPVVLPSKGVARERWLTRNEVARLLWAAWRLRQKWKGKASDRATAQHVARFIIAGFHTGTRASAICGAALRPTIGRGWIDAEHGVFYRQPGGKRQTRKRQPSIRMPPRTDGAGVNLIIDQVSGNLINGNMRAAVILGRIVNVGRLGAGKAEFDFDLHANRRITYIGVTHRTRSVDELREETRAMWAALADAVRTKELRLPIDKIFPLEQAKTAQEYMRANRHFGKILLVP
jgi:hypothetical protein